jgi:hypothetical protein
MRIPRASASGSHGGIQFFGAFGVICGLGFSLFCLIDPFLYLMIPLGLGMLWMGLRYYAPYSLTLHLTNKCWNERSGMLWWKQSREGSFGELLAVRYTPAGEDNTEMLTLEWRDGRKTMVLQGSSNVHTLAQRITEALELHEIGEQSPNATGQNIWISNPSDVKTVQEHDRQSMRQYGRGLILFGSLWLTLTLLAGGSLSYCQWINWRLDTHGRNVPGKITEFSRDFSSEGDTYRIAYTFDLPSGQRVVDQASVPESELKQAKSAGISSLKSGASVMVEYLPENPTYRRLRGLTYANLSGSPVAGAIFLLLFIVIGVGIIQAGRKMKTSDDQR